MVKEGKPQNMLRLVTIKDYITHYIIYQFRLLDNIRG